MTGATHCEIQDCVLVSSSDCRHEAAVSSVV